MIKTTISIFTALIFLTHPSFLFSQAVNYDDVAVIVNDSSAVSVSIGNYFAGARGIPANRIIHIQTSTQETIDSLQFEDMRAQIEAELMMGNLLDTVNYLVTTKGMPLRVSVNGACDSLSNLSYSVTRCTCVESELPLILSPEAGEILKTGIAANPYAAANQHFDRDTYGIFLVSRLDGFNQADVFDLIDRSGPGQLYSLQNGHVVADLSRIPPSTGNIFGNRVQALIDSMVSTGVPVFYDADSYNWLSPQTNVAGYFGVHYAEDSLQMGHSWEPGALAYVIGPRPGTTFDSTINPAGPYLLASLISEGASVAIGPIGPSYLGPSPTEYDLLPYYFDTLATPRYSAAEAYYMASAFLSLQTVMVGDPKTSVQADIPAAVLPPEENPLAVYPNPTSGTFTVTGKLPGGESALEIRNVLGQSVLRREFKHGGGTFKQEIDLGGNASGIYFLRLQRGEDYLVKKIVLEN